MFSPKKLWSLTPRNESVGRGASGSRPNPAGASEAVLEHDSLTDKVSKLENELFEYQYNMGLLLIEKKDWNSKFEDLTQALNEATDVLKREQAAHSSAISEIEKREENLRKALGVERQCVIDLEKALREIRSEYAEIKFNADSKLAEANALITSVEERSLEVEAKFHAADAKLAEVSRKNSELERKLQELEGQENAIRRDRSLFSTAREAHDAAITKQREELRDWEQRLKEAEERLADGRRLLNQRELRANENDKLLKEKHHDLEELEKKIDKANSDLKNTENDISSRLAIVTLKEKEADNRKKTLEEKERQLLDLKEKLDTREKLEMQKLLDEHKSVLAEKEKEFEKEMDERRKLQDEQLKNKVAEIENKEAEIMHMEEKVKKREQAIEKKLEKTRAKETDLDLKSKALKEREKSLKADGKSLETDRKQMLVEKEELVRLKGELENLKSDTEKIQLKITEEGEKLKITEDEREELARLQTELKGEIEKYGAQSEILMKEADELKKEKERFEKEWDELDDKRAVIKKEQEYVLEIKRRIEKDRLFEDERLRNEKVEMQKYVQGELETLKLQKELFAATMEHEKKTLAESLQSEKSKLLHDIEMQKQEAETKMQQMKEETEGRLRVREKSFEEERERELSNINFLKEVASREMQDMKLERIRIEKEKLEIAQNKQHAEEQQNELKKDIEELVNLSQKLKDQRENFIRERERFISFAEQQKSCIVCGDAIRDFMLSDLHHPLVELKSLEAPPPLPRVAENYLKRPIEGTSERTKNESSPISNLQSPDSGKTVSWLRQCTSKIFRFSAGKKLELDDAQDPIGTSAGNKLKDSRDPIGTLKIVESNGGIKEGQSIRQPSFDQYQITIPENSRDSNLRAGKRGRPKGGRKQRAKTLNAGSESQFDDGDAENSVYTNEESLAESDLPGTPPKGKRKRKDVHRSVATDSGNLSERNSDSNMEVDRPNRRQRTGTSGFVQKRYNLRTKKPTGALANGSLPTVSKGKKKAETTHSRRIEGEEDEPLRSTGIASEFSADNLLKGPVENEDSSEALHGTAEEAGENGGEEFDRESSHGEDDDDDNDNDGDDDEVEHPGEASVGKKLWTFLTT